MNTKTLTFMKRLLVLAILWALAITGLHFILDNVHHVIVFAAGVSAGIFAYMKLTKKLAKQKS